MLLSEAVALRFGARARLRDMICVFHNVLWCHALFTRPCHRARLCNLDGDSQVGKASWPHLWQVLRWDVALPCRLVVTHPQKRIPMRQVALDLFEATWEEMIGTPSRQSVDEETPVRLALHETTHSAAGLHAHDARRLSLCTALALPPRV